MSILKFLEVSKDFFDSIYSPFCDSDSNEYDHNNDILDTLSDEENQIIEEEYIDVEECYCNLCYIIKKIIPSKKKVL